MRTGDLEEHQWAPFAASPGPDAPITVTLTRNMFPFWGARAIKTIESVAVYRPPATPGDELELLVELTGVDAPKLDTEWTHLFDPGSKDLWLLATWRTWSTDRFRGGVGNVVASDRGVHARSGSSSPS